MADLKKVLLIAFLLGFSYQHIAGAGPSSPRDCCFAFWAKGPLRIRNITSYYMADSECNLEAVVFVMNNGKLICANPAVTWVQRAMAILQEKQ